MENTLEVKLRGKNCEILELALKTRKILGVEKPKSLVLSALKRRVNFKTLPIRLLLLLQG